MCSCTLSQWLHTRVQLIRLQAWERLLNTAPHDISLMSTLYIKVCQLKVDSWWAKLFSCWALWLVISHSHGKKLRHFIYIYVSCGMLFLVVHSVAQVHILSDKDDSSDVLCFTFPIKNRRSSRMTPFPVPQARLLFPEVWLTSQSDVWLESVDLTIGRRRRGPGSDQRNSPVGIQHFFLMKWLHSGNIWDVTHVRRRRRRAVWYGCVYKTKTCSHLNALFLHSHTYNRLIEPVLCNRGFWISQKTLASLVLFISISYCDVLTWTSYTWSSTCLVHVHTMTH